MPGRSSLPERVDLSSPPDQSEMLVWQPLADTPMNGLDMKQAIRPNSRATWAQIWR